MRVVLTGGATGIGAATLRRLADRGDEVHVFDVAPPEAGLAVSFTELDLSDAEAIDAAAAGFPGPIDALINNAGLPPREGLTERVLSVNVFGLIRFTEALLSKMAKGGAIVSTASRAGARWRENIAQVKALLALSGAEGLPAFIADQGIDHVRAYDLSKEAVIVWSMAQTERLIARDLRANTVSPAAISTGILDDFAAAFGERMSKAIARAGRPGTPEEVAGVIAFLASPESHWIKGQDITIDGGKSAMSLADTLGI